MPTKGSTVSCFGSVHPMSCGWHDMTVDAPKISRASVHNCNDVVSGTKYSQNKPTRGEKACCGKWMLMTVLLTAAWQNGLSRSHNVMHLYLRFDEIAESLCKPLLTENLKVALNLQFHNRTLLDADKAKQPPNRGMICDASLKFSCQKDAKIEWKFIFVKSATLKGTK